LNAPNVAAYELYRKLGFEEEGRLRKQVYLDGNFQDIIVMGKLL
jgi:RimJ/RimL family protein N-acetyltransferase